MIHQLSTVAKRHLSNYQLRIESLVSGVCVCEHTGTCGSTELQTSKKSVSSEPPISELQQIRRETH